MDILKSGMIAVRVEHEGDHVQLIINGALIFNVPWKQAIEISRAIYKHAKAAEELSEANRIIHEEAALVRSGAPISLTSHPALKAEAGKEAAWGWVRRYLPNRIRQKGMVYGPTVTALPPKKEG